MKLKAEEILRVKTKGTININEGSPLHRAVISAMKYYAKQQCGIPVAIQQSAQLFCGVSGGFCPYEEGDRKCRAEHKCINQVEN